MKNESQTYYLIRNLVGRFTKSGFLSRQLRFLPIGRLCGFLQKNALHVLAKINGSVEAQNILGEIKNTVTEKTEKLMTYGFLCIFVGVMLSVFQQAVGIIAAIFVWKLVPETKGKTLEDMTKLWKKN